MCELAIGEILQTLTNNLRESDKSTVVISETEYYDCAMKNDPKYKLTRCQECIPCTYFNFLTLYTQKNNDVLVQCKQF